MPSLLLSLAVKSLICRVLSLLSWKTRMGSRIKPNDSEGNSNLLLHLDYHRFMGPGGIYQRVLRELVEVFAKPLPVVCWQSWSTWEVPDNWRDILVEGGSRELLTCQPDLSIGKGLEADCFESEHTACERQAGD